MKDHTMEEMKGMNITGNVTRMSELYDEEGLKETINYAIYYGRFDQELIEEAYMLHGITQNMEDL